MGGKAALTLTSLLEPGLHTEMRTPEYFRTEFIDHFAEISCFNQEVLLGNGRKAVQGRP